MNNSTTVDSCGLPLVISYVKDQAYFVVFFVLTPIYFLVAFSGHLLLIIGFVKRAKTDPAYTYQIYMTVTKTVEIFFFTVFVIGYKWCSGLEYSGQLWFQRNYILMWIATKAIVPIQNSCITTSLLMAVAMAADRMFALWKPFVYKNINRKRHQLIAVITCLFFGWSSSIFDCFRFQISFNGDHYVGKVDSVYVGGVLSQALANWRNVIRALGVIGLIACNVAIIVLYRQKALVKDNLDKSATVSAAEEKRANDRKSSERALTIIVIGQSICITLSVGMFVAYYIIAYARNTFSLCASGILFASFMDGMLELGDVITFLLVTTTDKKMRSTIRTALTRKIHQHQVHATFSRTVVRSPSVRHGHAGPIATVSGHL